MLFGPIGLAQTANKKVVSTAQQHYPNPYETPDPNRPVDVDPFTWKDFPTGEFTSKTMQDAYNEAFNKHDGYKMLQLAKVEYDLTWTYGTLKPNQMAKNAFDVAVVNKDPFLAFYVAKFNRDDNFSVLMSTVREMLKTTYQLALERREAKVVYLLADMEDKHVIMEEVTPKDIRMQALFINNKNFAPYPNPYDSPSADKPLNRSPFLWKDFPANLTTETQLTTAYNEALKINDGYKLLQLAKVVTDKPLSKTLTAGTMLAKAYTIAQYNKDPFLMIYITLFEKDNDVLKGVEPADIFRNAYNSAVERRDTKALRHIYLYEQENDFLPDMTPKKILQKMQELSDKKPIL